MFNSIINKPLEINAGHSENVSDSAGMLTNDHVGLEESVLMDLIAEGAFESELDESNGGYFVKSVNITDEYAYGQLVHEAYVTLNLKHISDKLQTIEGIRYINNTLYVAYKRIHGKTFSNIIDEYFLAPEEPNTSSIVSILSQVVDELAILYEKSQFTHYDLHPDNIMIDENGEIVILDLEMSSARICDVTHGVELLSEDDESSLITPSYYWPADIFKLLCMIKYRISGLDSDYNNDNPSLFNEHYMSTRKSKEVAPIQVSEIEDEEDDELLSMLNNDEREYMIVKERFCSRVFDNKLEKFVDLILSYFMNPEYFDELYTRTRYFAAPRIDLIKDYSEYLTNFKHFHGYFNNIVDVTRRLLE